MRLADNERFEKSERSAQEYLVAARSARELNLMSVAVNLRDDALEKGGWSDDHTEVLNQIGEALVTELDWKESSVHKYLKSVVESIEGLEYDLDENDLPGPFG